MTRVEYYYDKNSKSSDAWSMLMILGNGQKILIRMNNDFPVNGKVDIGNIVKEDDKLTLGKKINFLDFPDNVKLRVLTI